MAKIYDIQRQKLRWLMALVMLFSLVPSALLLTVGILILAWGHATKDTVFGVLTLGLASTLLGGVVATVFYVRRETSVARLQTEFVSKVSHDLRTPLTSIRLFVETLQEGRLKEPDKIQQVLDLIALETGRLSAMINRLLGWARMEAGRRLYQFELESPERVLDTALSAFEAQRLTADVKLERRVEPDLPPIRADVQALSEAVLNLLQNAFHYTSADKVIALSCSLRGRNWNGNRNENRYDNRYDKQIAITVTDNGPGIPKQEHRRIFEKFYRITRDDLPVPVQIQGTGLGLAMVHHIVRAHGGSVTVESELGRGATFIILLPIATPDTPLSPGSP